MCAVLAVGTIVGRLTCSPSESLDLVVCVVLAVGTILGRLTCSPSESLDLVVCAVFQSAATYASVSELTYLDMCINESMRMFPPGLL